MYKSTNTTQVAGYLQSKLESFDVHHHQTVIAAYRRHMGKFEAQLGTNRCRSCWLRFKDCYCSYIATKKELFHDQLQEIHQKARVLMYYHYHEIGRSANTAHLYELLDENCSKLLFVDSGPEIELFEKMKEDYDEGLNSYCVLFPTSSSIGLSEWLRTRNSKDASKPVTLIALDGTYAKALRQFKHIKKSSALYDFPLQVVKLDIGEQGLKSALSGLMNQPAKEKICTFQAVVLALRELGLDPHTCDMLNDELRKWLEHIVIKNIKRGKSKTKIPKGLLVQEEPLSDDDEDIVSDPDEDIASHSISIEPYRSLYYDTMSFMQPAHVLENVLSSNQHVVSCKHPDIILIKTKKFEVFNYYIAVRAMQ